MSLSDAVILNRPPIRVAGARAGRFGLVCGGVCIAVSVTNLIWLGQAFSPRALVVLGIIASGGAIAGFFSHLVGEAVAARWRSSIRFVIMTMALIGGTFAFSGGIFAFVHRDIVGGVDPVEFEQDGFLAVLLSYGSAAYLMYVSGWEMYFPVPLLLASAISAWLFARRRL